MWPDDPVVRWLIQNGASKAQIGILPFYIDAVLEGVPTSTEQALVDVFSVYGSLSDGDLREEYLQDRRTMLEGRLTDREFALERFGPDRAHLPFCLGTHAANRLDGIPLSRWPSFHTLAQDLRYARRRVKELDRQRGTR